MTFYLFSREHLRGHAGLSDVTFRTAASTQESSERIATQREGMIVGNLTWRSFPYHLTRSHLQEKNMLYLYFVTEKDEADKQGEPVVASAGRTEEDSWRMLASNRQRMTGLPQDAGELKRTMSERGFHVEKYAATPL